MAETNLGATAISNMTGTLENYSVDIAHTDGATGQKEYSWQNHNWTTQYGYYKNIPECKNVINTKSTWTMGKGYIANEITDMLLMNIRGNGKDTFNTILENMIRTYYIGGDSYAEIIRDKTGQLLNLKVLDPSTVVIIQNDGGRIIRYEQTAKTNAKQVVATFQPIDILHLSRNRTADEIHGESMVDCLADIILMRNEAMQDMKTLMHRHVKPRIVWKLDTDDEAKIAAFKAKTDNSTNLNENIYIPMGAVEHEILAVSANATLNPLPWIAQLNDYFYDAASTPEIVINGGKNFTEASSKIAYLAWQQTIEEEQLYIEEQVLAQLNIEIELEFPASLENELLSDQVKGEKGVEKPTASVPSDTQVTSAKPGAAKF